jgi:hypothetical protein
VFDFETSEGLLQALLAATAITWSLQLQLIWRAFDTVKRTKAMGIFLALLLVLGLAALVLPVTALALRAQGVANGTYLGLFWTSIGLSALFMAALFVSYTLLIVVFIRRR